MCLGLLVYFSREGFWALQGNHFPFLEMIEAVYTILDAKKLKNKAQPLNLDRNRETQCFNLTKLVPLHSALMNTIILVHRLSKQSQVPLFSFAYT